MILNIRAVSECLQSDLETNTAPRGATITRLEGRGGSYHLYGLFYWVLLHSNEGQGFRRSTSSGMVCWSRS